MNSTSTHQTVIVTGGASGLGQAALVMSSQSSSSSAGLTWSSTAAPRRSSRKQPSNLASLTDLPLL